MKKINQRMAKDYIALRKIPYDTNIAVQKIIPVNYNIKEDKFSGTLNYGNLR